MFSLRLHFDVTDIQFLLPVALTSLSLLNSFLLLPQILEGTGRYVYRSDTRQVAVQPTAATSEVVPTQSWHPS